MGEDLLKRFFYSDIPHPVPRVMPCPCCKRPMMRYKRRHRCGGVYMSGDHIVRRAQGGITERENLRIVCRDCNASLPQHAQCFGALACFIAVTRHNRWQGSHLRECYDPSTRRPQPETRYTRVVGRTPYPRDESYEHGFAPRNLVRPSETDERPTRTRFRDAPGSGRGSEHLTIGDKGVACAQAELDQEIELRRCQDTGESEQAVARYESVSRSEGPSPSALEVALRRAGWGETGQ